MDIKGWLQLIGTLPFLHRKVYLSIYVVSQHNWTLIVFLVLTLIKVKRSSLTDGKFLPIYALQKSILFCCQCSTPSRNNDDLVKIDEWRIKASNPIFNCLLEKSRLVGFTAGDALGIMTCLKISNHRHLTSHYPAATLFSACCHSRATIFSHRSHTRHGFSQHSIKTIFPQSWQIRAGYRWVMVLKIYIQHTSTQWLKILPKSLILNHSITNIDLNARSIKGWTAYMLSCKNGHK